LQLIFKSLRYAKGFLLHTIIFAAVSFDLITEAPSWMILLCLMLGAGFAAILYFKNRRNPRIAKWMLWLMAFLRFLSVSLLAILLLNPLLKYIDRTYNKPQIILAVDNSKSMLLQPDSALTRSFVTDFSEKITSELSDKYEFVHCVFGEEIHVDGDLNYKEQLSDLSQIVDQSQNLFGSANGKAMIVLSDGIFNHGRNPAFRSLQSSVPIHTIGVGDTTLRRDIRISGVRINSITFSGNQFPVEVDVSGTRVKGVRSELSIWRNGEKLTSKIIDVNQDPFVQTHSFILNADKVGANNLVVQLGMVEGDYNKSNNVYYTFTEVIDGRQKILINAHAPHPDLAALKAAIQGSDQYEVVTKIGDMSSPNNSEYDLIITHQMPANALEEKYLLDITERKIPHLAILGASTDVNRLNRSKLGLKIEGNRSNFNQSQNTWNKDFSLFESDENWVSLVEEMPPLVVPFGQYQGADIGDIAFFQKIGVVKTQMPLLSFFSKEGHKQSVLAGEGIWRWRIDEFEQNENFELFDAFWRKVVQYLALKDDKRKFRVFPSRSSYFENEKVMFRAEVYNDNYEQVNKANVDMKLRGGEGQEFSFNFFPSGTAYRLDAGNIPVGQYAYVASTQIGGKRETQSGTIFVKPLILEELNLTADFNLLQQMATNSGGEFYKGVDAMALIEKLRNDENSKVIARSTTSFNDVIDLKWLFALIFGLMAMEWMLRRWAGTY
jgi:hypothetical protein